MTKDERDITDVFFERSTALSAASQVQAHEGAIASRTVPASGLSHSHVQHMMALLALRAIGKKSNWPGNPPQKSSMI
jgi:hypothetical protein